MHRKWNRVSFLVISLTLIFNIQNALASGSGGIRIETPHAAAFGKGTSFVGEANDPSAVYYNPAGLTQLKEGNYVSTGFSVISPSSSHTDFAGNESQMTRQNFPIPHIYVVSDFGLDKWSFGLGGTSLWGSGTAWTDDSFSRYVATRSDIANIDTMLTAAYQFNDQWSFAAGLDHDYSQVNKSKKLAQAGGADGDFNLKIKAGGFGYRLATLFKLNEQHQFGVMYRSPIQEKYRGRLFLHDLNASGSNYLGIFGGAAYDVQIAVQSELPQSAVMGYSFTPDDKWVFNFDVEWMDWSSFTQEWIEYTEVITALQSAVLNGGNPASRDWEDVWSASFGGEYAWSNDLRVRAGYYYHTAVVPEVNWESNLLDSNSHGVTAGFGYDLTENTTLDMAYSFLKYENHTIDNAAGDASGGSIDGKYEQIMHIGLITLGYKF